MPVVDLPDDDVSGLDPLVSLDDLKARYDVTDDDQASLALEDISALVRDVAGSEKIWTDVTKVPSAIKVIVLRATMRYLNNPDGFQNESVGPYSYGYAKDFSVGLFLTDGEMKQIVRISGVGKGIRTIRMSSHYTGGRDDFAYPNNTVYAQPYNDTNPLPVWDASQPY